MSQSVTLNSQTYTIPDNNDTNWGQNLTNYFVAIPAGVLQKSGGTFTLAADVDFGASFGLKSLYFKSRTTNPASAGVVRLASAEGMYWRNAANSADLSFVTDSSDRFVLSNALILSAMTASTVPYLDASKVLTSSSVTPTELGGLHSLTASRALATDASGILAASAVTATELGYVSGVTSAIQTQLAAKAALAGATFTGQVTMQNSSGNPIHGTNTNDSAASGYVGEYIESVVTSGSAVSAALDQQFFNVTSISLTAGDWDIVGQIIFTINGATYKAVGSAIAVSVDSGNTTTDHVPGDNVMSWLANPTAGSDQGGYVSWRKSLASTTTIYLKGWTGFSAGTPKAYGKIYARRRR